MSEEIRQEFEADEEKEKGSSLDLARYLIRLGGDQLYLPVAARVAWMRRERPGWTIQTEPIRLDIERKLAVFRATILDEEGRVIAVGTKSELGSDFHDYIEKAESGSVGRALAFAGFGTLYAVELAENEFVVDSPVASSSAPSASSVEPGGFICEKCGIALRQSQYDWSMARYHRPLCPRCQRELGVRG